MQNTIKINNSAKIYAFIENLQLHIGAVKNFNHYVKNWLKANTTEHFEETADTITPNKTLTTVIATKEISVQHMSHLKNLLIAIDPLAGNRHYNLANQEPQNHQKRFTLTKQLGNLTVALEGLLKVVGAV